MPFIYLLATTAAVPLLVVGRQELQFRLMTVPTVERKAAPPAVHPGTSPQTGPAPKTAASCCSPKTKRAHGCDLARPPASLAYVAPSETSASSAHHSEYSVIFLVDIDGRSR